MSFNLHIFLAAILFVSTAEAADIGSVLKSGTFAQDGLCKKADKKLTIVDGINFVGNNGFSCEIFNLQISSSERTTGFARVLCNLGDVDERIIDDVLFVGRSDVEIEITSRNDLIDGGKHSTSTGISGIYSKCKVN